VKQLENKVWLELEQFLNNLADEREDYCGPNNTPTANAHAAQAMIKTLGMERREQSDLS